MRRRPPPLISTSCLTQNHRPDFTGLPGSAALSLASAILVCVYKLVEAAIACIFIKEGKISVVEYGKEIVPVDFFQVFVFLREVNAQYTAFVAGIHHCRMPVAVFRPPADLVVIACYLSHSLILPL